MTRACDQCIRKRRLCTRLYKVSDVVKFAVYPLPESARNGKQWTDLAFWSQG